MFQRAICVEEQSVSGSKMCRVVKCSGEQIMTLQTAKCAQGAKVRKACAVIEKSHSAEYYCRRTQLNFKRPGLFGQLYTRNLPILGNVV